MNEMQPWVDDALDLVEFANGDADTYWGKKRAEMGHPEPFNMEYICLGNEEDDTPQFRERCKLIADALREKYPEIKVIGTSGTAAEGSNYTGLWEYSKEEELDAVDEHYYVSPNWLLANNHRYDEFDRNGPKVFVGEYASRDDRLVNAIAEAAYLTGIERNGDVVQFSCYAPLLTNVNHQQWHPDLIRFDNTRVSKTASYYVQQLFSTYDGNAYLDSKVSYAEGFDPLGDIYRGKIGVGSWNTQVQYDDVKLVSNGKTVLSENFSATPDNWEVLQGEFSTGDGVYMQESNGQPAWSVWNGSFDASDYTYSVKAKKTGGSEGFLVVFGHTATGDFYWLNLGGWNNTMHAVEQGNGQGKATLVSAPGSVNINEWYDIRVEVKKSIARVFLNDELLFEIPPPPSPVTASVVRNDATNELIIKLVNSSADAIDVQMDLTGGVIDQEAKVITFTGDPVWRNSLDTPDVVKPGEGTFHVTNNVTYTLPGNTLKVFVLNRNTIAQNR